jgi:hypothetical protein
MAKEFDEEMASSTLAKIAEPEMRADESINNFARRVLFAAARIYSDQDSVTTKIKEEWMKGVLIRGVLPELRERCPMAVMQPTFESVKEIYRAAEVNTMIGQGRAPKRTIGTRDPTNDPKSRSTSPRRVTWDASVRSIQAGTPDQQGLEEFRTLMRSDQYDMMNVFGQQNQVVMDRLDNIEKYIRPQRNHGEYMVNEIRTEGEQPQNGRCYFCGANTHRWRNCFQRKKRFGQDPKEASQVTYLPPYDLPFAPPSVRERIAQRGMDGTDPISNRYVANRTKGNVLEELEARLGGINSMEDVQRINAGGYLPELQCNALHQLDSDSEEEYEEEDNYHTGYLRCNFIQLNTPSDQPENNDEFDSEEEVQDSVILEGTDTDPIHESGTIDLSAIGIAPDPNQPNGMDLSQEPEEEEEPEQDEREPETWRPAAPGTTRFPNDTGGQSTATNSTTRILRPTRPNSGRNTAWDIDSPWIHEESRNYRIRGTSTWRSPLPSPSNATGRQTAMDPKGNRAICPHTEPICKDTHLPTTKKTWIPTEYWQEPVNWNTTVEKGKPEP